MHMNDVMCGSCRIHEAEAKVRGSMDEECDNICRLSCFVVSRVLTDWQAALLYVRTYPYAAHVMVSLLTVPQCNRCSISGWVAAAQHCKAVLQFAEAMQKRFSYASLRECGVSRPQ